MEIHKLENYDWKLIESLINNEVEESINIDYKAGEALDKADKKKAEISKDVSAFANSNGGIIIYGINELHHKPSSISFIDGTVFTKEWLEQIITSTIHRTITGVKIFPLRKDGDIKKTIYVVQIPESISAPHMAKDKRFYRRYNFESVFMDEYEVRNLYSKKSTADLSIETIRVSIEADDHETSRFTMEVDIENIGSTYTKDYKLSVYFDPIISRTFMIYNGINMQKVDITRFETKTKVSVEPRKSIYPNEIQNILRCEFSVSTKELSNFLAETNIIIKLNFPFGEDKIERNLIDFFDE